MTNETFLHVPISISDPELRSVLQRLISKVNTVGVAAQDSSTASKLQGLSTQLQLLTAQVTYLASSLSVADAQQLDITLTFLRQLIDALMLEVTTLLRSTGTSPTVGWKDLTGDVAVRGTGAANPEWTAFKNGIYAYAFPSDLSKEFWINFHIDHDYKPGSAIFPHVHFSLLDDAASGVVAFGIEYTIAKGHQQTSGSVFANTTTTSAAVTVPAGSASKHFVVEHVEGIVDTNIEPDSLMLVRFFRDNSVDDNLAATIFGFTADIHYQFDRYGTANKAPNFYGVEA